MLLHEPFPGLLQVVIWVVEEGKLEVGAERDTESHVILSVDDRHLGVLHEVQLENITCTNVCVCAREWLSIHKTNRRRSNQTSYVAVSYWTTIPSLPAPPPD